ncbi:MAG TPA: sialidase family protein [Thermoguttaceae bacterium]
MRNIIANAVLLLLLGTVGLASGATDVLIENDPLYIQNEISLTLIPGQPGRLAMAYNDLALNVALGIAYSADSGQTWSTKNLSLPTEPSGLSTMARGFDPSITADSTGKLYASFIADGATWAYGLPDSGLYVSTSTDYGNTWSSPVTVSYDGPPTWTPPNPPPPPDPNYRYNDRDQITVDTFVSNNVYASVTAKPWGGEKCGLAVGERQSKAAFHAPRS